MTDDSGGFRFMNVRPAKYFLGVIQSYRSSCSGAVSAGAANKPECVASPSRGSLAPERSLDAGTNIYETTFYPGVTSWPEAMALTVYPGEDRRDITLALESRPSVIVAGTVSGPNGPQADVIVSIVRSGNDGLVISDELRHVSSISDQNGHFSLAGVPPGSYDVLANYYPRTSTGKPPVRTTDAAGLPIIRGVVAGIAAPSEGNPVLQARVRFTVDPLRLNIIDVQLQRASLVRGIVDVAATSKALSEEIVGRQVTLQPLTNVGTNMGLQTAVTSAGTFEFPSVPQGTYLLRLATPPNSFLTLLKVNGATSIDRIVAVECCGVTDLVTTVAQATGRHGLGGAVRTSGGKAESDATVFVFPVSFNAGSTSSRSRFQAVHVRPDGSFFTPVMPDGVYLVVAVTRAWFPFEWNDPDVLTTLAQRATQVSLKNGTANPVYVTSIMLR